MKILILISLAAFIALVRSSATTQEQPFYSFSILYSTETCEPGTEAWITLEECSSYSPLGKCSSSTRSGCLEKNTSIPKQLSYTATWYPVSATNCSTSGPSAIMYLAGSCFFNPAKQGWYQVDCSYQSIDGIFLNIWDASTRCTGAPYFVFPLAVGYGCNEQHGFEAQPQYANVQGCA